MQMRTTRIPGPPGLPDELAAAHVVAFSNGDLGEMTVHSAQSRAVLDENDEPVPAHFTGKADLSTLHRGNGRADGDCDIDAMMEIGADAAKAESVGRG